MTTRTSRGKSTASGARRDPAEALPLTHVGCHILMALSTENRHGYGIIKHVAESTNGRMELEAGTLYAAIKRMKDDGWIVEARESESVDRRRRTYALSPFGRRVLLAEIRRLEGLLGLARDARLIPDAASGQA